MNAGESKFDVTGYTYNANTGAIYRNGRQVGSKFERYSRVKQVGNRVMAHRLAWRIYYGQWPDAELDHINGDKHDNRICNLRDADHSENNCNVGTTYRNTSGEKNVTLNKQHGKWMVKVKKGAMIVHSGASSSLSAICAARLIRRQLHGEFASSN